MAAMNAVNWRCGNSLNDPNSPIRRADFMAMMYSVSEMNVGDVRPVGRAKILQSITTCYELGDCNTREICQRIWRVCQRFKLPFYDKVSVHWVPPRLPIGEINLSSIRVAPPPEQVLDRFARDEEQRQRVQNLSEQIAAGQAVEILEEDYASAKRFSFDAIVCAYITTNPHIVASVHGFRDHTAKTEFVCLLQKSEDIACAAIAVANPQNEYFTYGSIPAFILNVETTRVPYWIPISDHPMVVAAGQGSVRIVQAMLNKGFQFVSEDNVLMYAILCAAINSGSADVFDLLMDQIPPEDQQRRLLELADMPFPNMKGLFRDLNLEHVVREGSLLMSMTLMRHGLNREADLKAAYIVAYFGFKPVLLAVIRSQDNFHLTEEMAESVFTRNQYAWKGGINDSQRIFAIKEFIQDLRDFDLHTQIDHLFRNLINIKDQSLLKAFYNAGAIMGFQMFKELWFRDSDLACSLVLPFTTPNEERNQLGFDTFVRNPSGYDMFMRFKDNVDWQAREDVGCARSLLEYELANIQNLAAPDHPLRLIHLYSAIMNHFGGPAEAIKERIKELINDATPVFIEAVNGGRNDLKAAIRSIPEEELKTGLNPTMRDLIVGIHIHP
ncbi:MAG: hypothetical protein H7A39_05335 [Chlamydiales bacterium]|nr:hypothetical protein [Chlamydiales bacterium]